MRLRELYGRTLAVTERPTREVGRAGLVMEAIGGPGGKADLELDDVEALVEDLDQWLERYGRRRER